MNYEHDYHAGNAADVFKHLVLLALLQALLKKQKPFFYLDTHAGCARYDLNSAHAIRTGEYRKGIDKLWSARHTFTEQTPTLLCDYLALIEAENPDGQLRYYPGSPLIAASQLRHDDRMTLIELAAPAHTTLKNYFSNQSQVSVHHHDGYQALKAFLPPSIARGLVLIDPPYEDANEFETLITRLLHAQQRWPTGIFALWYPIKQMQAIQHFYKRASAQLQPLLVCELCPLGTDVAQRLNGSGMLILNPPWQLDTLLRETLSCVLPHLQQSSAGSTRVMTLY